MTFTEILNVIYPYLVAALPALTAIASIIAVAIKIIKSFSELKKSVDDKTDLKEARAEMAVIIKQNSQLRAEIADLITAQSKVKYDDKEI